MTSVTLCDKRTRGRGIKIGKKSVIVELDILLKLEKKYKNKKHFL